MEQQQHQQQQHQQHQGEELREEDQQGSGIKSPGDKMMVMIALEDESGETRPVDIDSADDEEEEDMKQQDSNQYSNLMIDDKGET